jgi:hypothetical protein
MPHEKPYRKIRYFQSRNADKELMERSYAKKYNLRLPDEIYERIEDLGRKYDRSVNEQMVYMLRTWQEPAALEDRLARIEGQVFSSGPQKTTETTGGQKAI